MINKEIVTYLKGEEKFKDDYFIFEWAKYSSLIKADKDPGQYLPYLFIIYYFGPNETIQDAVKKLIDVITPKEILEFQEKFIGLVKNVDEDIVSLRALFEAKDFNFSCYEEGGPSLYAEGFLDYLEGGMFDDFDETKDGIYEKKIKKKFLKEISHIENAYEWIASYLYAFILPIDLIDDDKSALKIVLKENRYTNYYLTQLLYSIEKDFFLLSPEKDFFKSFTNNNFFLNHLLDMDNFVCCWQQYEEDMMFLLWTATINRLVAKTKTKKAVRFFEKMLSETSDWPESYEDIVEEIENLLQKFDNSLTHELRLNSEWLINPTTNDKEEFIKLCEIDQGYNPDLFKNAESHLKLDKDAAMAAINYSGSNLEYASKELQADKEVVMAAIKNRGSLKHASKELQADKELVMAAIKNDGRALQHTSKELQADKEVVLAAIKNRGSLKHASKELQADKELVMAAVKENVADLEYASKELRNDKELVMTALKKNYGNALQHASKELRNDKELVMAAVNKNYGNALTHASKELQADKEVVMAAVNKHGHALELASKELQADQELIALSKS